MSRAESESAKGKEKWGAGWFFWFTIGSFVVTHHYFIVDEMPSLVHRLLHLLYQILPAFSPRSPQSPFSPFIPRSPLSPGAKQKYKNCDCARVKSESGKVRFRSMDTSGHPDTTWFCFWHKNRIKTKDKGLHPHFGCTLPDLSAVFLEPFCQIGFQRLSLWTFYFCLNPVSFLCGSIWSDSLHWRKSMKGCVWRRRIWC